MASLFVLLYRTQHKIHSLVEGKSQIAKTKLGRQRSGLDSEEARTSGADL